MSNIEIAKEIAEDRARQAKAHRDRIVNSLDAMLRAERAAGFIEGVLHGVENGLSALNAIVQQAAEEKKHPSVTLIDPVPLQKGSHWVKEMVTHLAENQRRRPRGANEEIVLNILGNLGELGATVPEIIQFSSALGGPLADSSARVALEKLQARDMAFFLDGRWYPAAVTATPENPDAGASGELPLAT